MVLVPGSKPLGQRKTDVSSIDRKFDPNYPALPYLTLSTLARKTIITRVGDRNSG